MKQLVFSDIPRDWAICYQHECPMAVQCLRHHGAQLAPADTFSHNVVLPAARQGDECRAFVADEPVTLAYGMTQLYGGLKSWDVPRVRQAVQSIFGCQRHYYRYRQGRYVITPDQQAQVSAAFQRCGYTMVPQFDRTETTYYFPQVKR